MARSKPGGVRKWNRKTITRMQGLADEIRDPNNPKPPVDPIQWVMSTCGLSAYSVRRLADGLTVRGQKPGSNVELLHEDFAAAFGDLAEACSRRYAKIIEGIADDTDAAPAERFKTAKWCVETLNPMRYEPNKIAVEISTSTTTGVASDIDPRVWETISDDENDELAAVLEKIEELEGARDEIIAGVVKRLD